MNKRINILLLCAWILLPVATLYTGCKTSPSTQEVAYKTLKSIQQAAVAGLEVYGKAYQRGEIDDATRAKVHDLYKKYQAAWGVAATAAQFNYESPSTTELNAAFAELINLLDTIRK